MDAQSQQTLVTLIREQRIASLGTLRDGEPFVSLTLFAAAADFSAFYILASRLAQHTQDFLRDARVSLMIAETDANVADPQQLARVSMRGKIVAVPREANEYVNARALYLAKFPQAEFLFGLGDFSLYRITPHAARFVAGFAKAFDLSADELMRATRSAR